MKKENWIPGIPNKKGLYWFDAGFNKLAGTTNSSIIIQHTQNENYYFGNYMCGPISMIYNKHTSKNAKYMKIEPPTDFIAFENLVKNIKRYTKVWLKSKDGYSAIAILSQDAGLLRGDIIWLDHPTKASCNSTTIRSDDGYTFGIVKLPKN